VANASHELRTPLTAIRGFAETLLHGAAEDPAARERFLNAILRHTLRLQRLAEDLTLLAKSESPQHDFLDVPTDVRAVCRESIASLDTFAKKKSIRVTLRAPEEPVLIVTSPRALDGALINLVENAIKYSPDGSEVRVSVTREEETVTVAISDDGPGIPPKYHERIFERFYRVDKGRSRDEGGTGLGLSITRHLVNRMDGTLELQSAPGEGTTFRLVLPLDVPVDD